MFCSVLIRYFLLLILICGFSFSSSAQIRPGIKFGVSTPIVDPEDFIVEDQQGNDIYHVSVVKARYGVHAGAFIQMQLGHFFIQPELLYNSSSIDYRIDSLTTPNMGSHNFRDTYRSLDFPLMLGLKTGPVRIGGGPVGHIYFRDEGGFYDYVDEFNGIFEDLRWGWQAGIGLDFWKLHIDVRYEGNFAKLGDHITFFNKAYDFDTNNNRLIASLGFSF